VSIFELSVKKFLDDSSIKTSDEFKDFDLLLDNLLSSV
jgi:hypothetical protein